MIRLCSLIAILATPAVLAAPCATTGGDNALHSAALGLGAGEWCELTPTIVNGASVYDLVTSCVTGNTNEIQNYAESMAYDSSTNEIFFFGTPHGGGYRTIKYDIDTNYWSVESNPSSPCSTTSCTAVLEGGAIAACVGCDANHAYDSNTSDNRGNFYYQGTASWSIDKFNSSTGTWSNNFTTCPCDGAYHNISSTMDYWPSLGDEGSLVILGGYMRSVWAYDIAADSWSKIINSVSFDQDYHGTIEYHPSVDALWLVDGTGGGTNGNNQYRLWLDNGTPTLTALPEIPGSGWAGVTRSKCSADAATDDTIICWVQPEDTVGSTSAGWYAVDLSDGTWTSFSSLGITSMPPLFSWQNDTGKTGMTTARAPYGVTIWLSQRRDDQSGGGMFVYKHIDGGTAGPLDPPRNFRAD